MPNEQKLKWIRLAVGKSPVYLSELNQFLAEENLPKKRKLSVLSQPEKENLNQLDCKPESITDESIVKPKSLQLSSLGYKLFSRQLVFSDKFRILLAKDREIQLSTHWNRLSEKEKNEFNVEAEKFHQLYPLEFSNYLKSSLSPDEQLTVPDEQMDKGEKQDLENTSWTNFQIIATEDSYLNLNLKNIIGKE